MHVCTCICIHVHIHMCVHTNCRVPTLSSFQIACVLADAVGGPIRAPLNISARRLLGTKEKASDDTQVYCTSAVTGKEVRSS